MEQTLDEGLDNNVSATGGSKAMDRDNPFIELSINHDTYICNNRHSGEGRNPGN